MSHETKCIKIEVLLPVVLTIDAHRDDNNIMICNICNADVSMEDIAKIDIVKIVETITSEDLEDAFNDCVYCNQNDEN